MTKIDLPKRAWAKLRDPAEVTERLRRPVNRLVAQLSTVGGIPTADTKDDATLTPEQLDVMNDLNDAITVALVESWSYDEPVSVDALLALPGAAYDKLRNACSPLAKDLLPDFGPDGAKDPDSPSEPSDA